MIAAVVVAAQALGRRPASGLSARGYVRQPFAGGNAAATRHGAYSERRLRPLAQSIYEELRAALPVPWDDGFETAVRALAQLRARKELAVDWLDANGVVDDQGDPRGIARELGKWELREREIAADLALTIRSRAQLDLDRIAAERGLIELAQVRALLSAVVRAASEFVPAGERAALVARVESELAIVVASGGQR